MIVQASELNAPPVDEVRTEADAVAAFGEYLSMGLPVDGNFHDWGVDDGSRIGVRLMARVGWCRWAW